MINITSNSNGFTVEGVDNIFHPDNGTLVFAVNTVIMVMDDSDMVTFRSAANNDVLFSGIIGQIKINNVTVTKQNIVTKFSEVANAASGGGGGGDVQEEIEQLQREMALKADSADLATVATSGSYNDLSNKPTIPAAQVQSDWNQSDSSAVDYIKNKPVIPTVPTNVSAFTNDAGYITQEQVIINESFPNGWHTTGTMSDLISDINNDSDALVGKFYMGTVSFSDLPTGVSQAELQVEVMSEIDGIGKVLVFTVTSADVSPYHWEYTSAYGASGTWRSWVNSSDIANYFDGVVYDALAKRINFKHNNIIKAYVDTRDFVKDGMVSNVEISNNNLVITFNTDAGKEPISIPLTDIFNPSNYYNKTDCDNKFAVAANLATVATSGSYNDLSNKPTIPAAQVQSDWEQSNSSSVDYIKNKPDLSVYAESSNLATVATSGDYDDLSNKPTIPTVPTNVSAFTNDAGYLTEHQSLSEYYTKTQSDARYLDKATFDTKEETISAALNDLDSGKQDVLTAGQGITITNNVISATGGGGGGTQVQANWQESDTTSPAYIQNKPNLATVATSGDYDDLSNKPTIPTVPTNVSDFTNDAGYVTASSLATVATSGSYNDLSDKPTIPTVPTNVSDFTNDAGYVTASSLSTVATSGSYNDLSNKPTIPDVSDYVEKTVFNAKELAVANALTELNEVKADKSELPDVSSFVTASSLSTVATSGSYDDLSDKPTIPTVPTNVSDFTNDAGYLVSTDFKTINNQSIVGSGNIEIQSGGTQVQADWNQTDTTAVDYIKNKPTIPDTSAFMTTAAFDVKEEVISAALNELDARIGNINTLLEGI